MKKKIVLLLMLAALTAVTGCGQETAQTEKTQLGETQLGETQLEETQAEEIEAEDEQADVAREPIEEADLESLAEEQEVEGIKITSENLKEGVWDNKISNTDDGENISPQLSWEAVEGANEYFVFMLDKHFLHMILFTEETSIAEGAIKEPTETAKYVGPYPPAGTTHDYKVYVVAMKEHPKELNYYFDASGNFVDDMMVQLDMGESGETGNIIETGELVGTYTREYK